MPNPFPYFDWSIPAAHQSQSDNSAKSLGTRDGRQGWSILQFSWDHGLNFGPDFDLKVWHCKSHWNLHFNFLKSHFQQQMTELLITSWKRLDFVLFKTLLITKALVVENGTSKNENVSSNVLYNIGHRTCPWSACRWFLKVGRQEQWLLQVFYCKNQLYIHNVQKIYLDLWSFADSLFNCLFVFRVIHPIMTMRFVVHRCTCIVIES